MGGNFTSNQESLRSHFLRLIACDSSTDGVWTLRPMADEWSGCNPSRSSACPAHGGGQPAADAVVVDVGACMRRNGTCRTAGQVGAGVLLSLNATHPRTEVIEPLHLHAHRGDWGVLPAVHERLTTLGIRRSEPLLADLWCYKHGCDHGFTSLGAKEWPGDNGDWTGWEAFVKETVRAAPVGVVFDIWNEPGQNGYVSTQANILGSIKRWNVLDQPSAGLSERFL